MPVLALAITVEAYEGVESRERGEDEEQLRGDLLGEVASEGSGPECGEAGETNGAVEVAFSEFPPEDDFAGGDEAAREPKQGGFYEVEDGIAGTKSGGDGFDGFEDDCAAAIGDVEALEAIDGFGAIDPDGLWAGNCVHGSSGGWVLKEDSPEGIEAGEAKGLPSLVNDGLDGVFVFRPAFLKRRELDGRHDEIELRVRRRPMGRAAIGVLEALGLPCLPVLGKERGGVGVCLRAGVVVKYLGGEISKKRIDQGLSALIAAECEEVVGEILREEDCGDARAAGGGLERDVMFVHEVLRLIDPKEDRSGCGVDRPSFHGTLPTELEQHLGEDTDLVEELLREIEDDDAAVERFFRGDAGFLAEESPQEPAEEWIGGTGEVTDNGRAVPVGLGGKLTHPVVVGELEVGVVAAGQLA